MNTVLIKVRGRVQGVFFRQSTLEKALELGINGTVRNDNDNSVEIVATATEEKIASLVNWCHEGPPRAIVTDVSTQELPLQLFHNFSIIRY